MTGGATLAAISTDSLGTAERGARYPIRGTFAGACASASWTEADIEVACTKTSNFLLIGFPLRLFGLALHRKPSQCWGMLVLSGVLLRDQYHKGKGSQPLQNAINRRINRVLAKLDGKRRPDVDRRLSNKSPCSRSIQPLGHKPGRATPSITPTSGIYLVFKSVTYPTQL